MARRVSDNFRAGFISDSYSAQNSLSQLHNMYLRESGEAISRGRIGRTTASATNALQGGTLRNPIARSVGFHPNFGLGLSMATASASATAATASPNMFTYNRNVFAVSPLISTAPVSTAYPYQQTFSWSIITEGTGISEVPVNATATTISPTGVQYENITTTLNTGNEMIMAGQFGSLFKWAGATFSPYKTGTVAVAASFALAVASGMGGGRIITGTGTTWSTGVQAGMYIMINGLATKANGTQRAYRITRVISNTQLEIELPIYTTGTATGLSYRIQAMAVIQSPDGVWNRTNERPTQGGIAAYHQGRLFTAVTSDADTAYNTVFNYDRLRWSGSLDENGTYTYPDASAASSNVATGVQSGNSQGFSHVDLWHPNAHIDVFPGIGGAINGLCSVGNELVIIKDHAMFRLTGQMDWQGNGSGLALSIINTEVGAVNPRAWVYTSRGLIIADQDGLYLYDGESVASITDGRIQEFWKFNYAENAEQVILSQFEDKVFVSNGASGLVWDMEKDFFYTIDHRGDDLSTCVGTQVYAVDDSYVGDFIFNGAVAGSATATASISTFSIADFTNINHKRSNYVLPIVAGTLELGVGASPETVLRTLPIPLGEDANGEGRVNNVYVHFFARRPLYGGFPNGDPNSGIGNISIDLTYGRSQAIPADADNQIQSGTDNTMFGGTVPTNQRQINLRNTGPQTYSSGLYVERVVRFPIDDSIVSNAVSITVTGHAQSEAQVVAVTDKLVIYSVSVDYEPVKTGAGDMDVT